ncbi:MAG: hypothetical protein ABSC94_15910 [Polyangiaceae bacterium]
MNAASPVTLTFSTNAAPTATGGTVASGTYYLTSETEYGSTTDCDTSGASETVQSTVVVTGSTYNVVTQTVITAGAITEQTEARSTATFAIAGNTFVGTTSCPASDASADEPEYFSATSTQLTIGGSPGDADAGSCVMLRVYTKQ